MSQNTFRNDGNLHFFELRSKREEFSSLPRIFKRIPYLPEGMEVSRDNKAWKKSTHVARSEIIVGSSGRLYFL